MVKAVFFDIDDTLFHFSEASSNGMKKVENFIQEATGIKEEDLQRAIHLAQEKIGNRLGYTSAAFHNRQIRFQNALEILGMPIFPYATRMYEIYWNTVLEEASLEPGLLELLKELKKHGVFLGIATDMTSYIQNKKLERLNIAQYFDAVITSEEAGCDKPDRAIFDLCIQKSGYEKEECLFIGDHKEKDYAGAKAAGMKAICYAKYSGGVEEDEKKNIHSYEKAATDILELCVE